jgi:hypothetical protein
LANADVVPLGYVSSRPLGNTVERRGTVESRRQQAAGLVCLSSNPQHTRHPGDNIYLRIQQEEISTTALDVDSVASISQTTVDLNNSKKV